MLTLPKMYVQLLILMKLVILKIFHHGNMASAAHFRPLIHINFYLVQQQSKQTTSFISEQFHQSQRFAH